MKWGPQPKPRCARPDCDKHARQLGYCPNHAALLDRNGSPYTQEEMAGMHAANRHEQEMDAALAKNPPTIVWQFDPRRKVQVAIYVRDPHAERSAEALRERERHEEFEVFLEEAFAPQPAVEPECTDENLLAAAKADI